MNVWMEQKKENDVHDELDVHLNDNLDVFHEDETR